MFINMVKTLCYNNPEKMDRLNHALMQTVFKGKFTDSEFRIIAELGAIPVSQLQCLIGCEPDSVLHVLYIQSETLRKNNLDETLSSAILKILNYLCSLLTKFIKLLGSLRGKMFNKLLFWSIIGIIETLILIKFDTSMNLPQNIYCIIEHKALWLHIFSTIILYYLTYILGFIIIENHKEIKILENKIKNLIIKDIK